MQVFITPKNLMNIRGFAYITAQRRIKKAKNHFNCTAVSVVQYCELFKENPLDIYALLNSKNNTEYMRIMKEGKEGGFKEGF